MAEVSFKTSSGRDPATYVIELAGAVKPTVGDALYAAQRQRTRMVDRTLRGVDVEGASFEPYDTSRPYYYYPQGRVGRNKSTVKQRKAAARRLLKRIGEVESNFQERHWGKIPGINKHGDTGARLTRNGQGLRFDNYAAFKMALGRAGVDLTGPRAPHMLQAIEVHAGGTGFGTADVSSASSEPVNEFTIGIYGEPAGRARAHNTGYCPRWAREHKRYFLGASAADLQQIVADLYARIRARLMKGKR
jgi:hypothetical protein